MSICRLARLIGMALLIAPVTVSAQDAAADAYLNEGARELVRRARLGVCASPRYRGCRVL